MTKSDVPERWVELAARTLRATDFDRHPIEHYLDDAEIVLEPVLADLRRQVEALAVQALTGNGVYDGLRGQAFQQVLDLLDTGGSDE